MHFRASATMVATLHDKRIFILFSARRYFSNYSLPSLEKWQEIHVYIYIFVFDAKFSSIGVDKNSPGDTHQGFLYIWYIYIYIFVFDAKFSSVGVDKNSPGDTHQGFLYIWYNSLIRIYIVKAHISHTLVGTKLVDDSDVVGASPVGAAPTTPSFST